MADFEIEGYNEQLQDIEREEAKHSKKLSDGVYDDGEKLSDEDRETITKFLAELRKNIVLIKISIKQHDIDDKLRQLMNQNNK